MFYSANLIKATIAATRNAHTEAIPITEIM